jgi:hypothetical protein
MLWLSTFLLRFLAIAIELNFLGNFSDLFSRLQDLLSRLHIFNILHIFFFFFGKEDIRLWIFIIYTLIFFFIIGLFFWNDFFLVFRFLGFFDNLDVFWLSCLLRDFLIQMTLLITWFHHCIIIEKVGIGVFQLFMLLMIVFFVLKLLLECIEDVLVWVEIVTVLVLVEDWVARRFSEKVKHIDLFIWWVSIQEEIIDWVFVGRWLRRS